MEINSDLLNAFQNIKNTDLKSLQRQELGVDYNFETAVQIIESIYADLSIILENAEQLRVSDSTTKQINDLAIKTSRYIDKIKTFVLKGNEANASSQHSEIISGLRNLYQQDLEILPQLIERINNQRLNAADVRGQIEEALAAVKEIKKIKTEAEESKNKVDVAIKEVREAFGKEGASVSSGDFKNTADEHKRVAASWFRGIIASLIMTSVLIIFLFNAWWPFTSLDLTHVDRNDYPRIMQALFFKILLLSVAYLVVYQCIKNYKVNQHLYIQNRHRHLALQVYPLMTNATSDTNQSNTIVTQAAKAIFDQGSTGYLESPDNPNPINLTEIINKVVDKA